VGELRARLEYLVSGNNPIMKLGSRKHEREVTDRLMPLVRIGVEHAMRVAGYTVFAIGLG
jgi:hypothetical protein